VVQFNFTMAGEEVASGGGEVVAVDAVAHAGAWESGGGASAGEHEIRR